MISIRPLHRDDDRSGFRCGEIELDYYFQKFAGQNQFKNYIGTNYVAVRDGKILGFVSVSAAQLYAGELPGTLKKRLPAYPLPVLRITRLGVDIVAQGRGIGTLLLRQMLLLALEMKEKTGCFGVVVDAKESSAGFYEALGFVRLETVKRTRTLPLFLATKVIEKAYGEKE